MQVLQLKTFELASISWYNHFSTACRYCPGLWWRIEANYKYVQVLVPLNSDQALQVAARPRDNKWA